MRSLGSLLRGGFVPNREQVFYQAYSEVPSLKFMDIEKRKRRPADYIFKPHEHDDLDKYYLWPYFPGKRIEAVILTKPIPFFPHGKKLQLIDGALRYKDLIIYDEEMIFMFPTFFKPIYT